MSYVRWKTVDFGAAHSGAATVGYTLYARDGSTTTARTTAGVLALGGGGYGAWITFPDAWVGTVYWDKDVGSAVYAIEPINPGADQFTDAAISTRNAVAPATPANVAAVAGLVLNALTADYVGTGSIGAAIGATGGDSTGIAAIMAYLLEKLTVPTWTLVSSTSASGVLTINRGDDYSADDNRALTISFTTGDDLSGGDTQWILDIGGGVLSVLSGVGTNTSGQTWAAVFHPTAVQTALLIQAAYVFTLTVRRGDPPTTLTEVYGTVAVRPAGYTATALDT